MRVLRAVVTLWIAAVLGGCVQVPLEVGEAAKSSIDAVCIDEHVAVTSKPEFLGGGIPAAVGLMLAYGSGGIASGAIQSAQDANNREYAQFLEGAGIDVGSIAREEFERRLRTNPFYAGRLTPTARYRFELEVPHHALIERTSLSKHYLPVVDVVVRLKGPSGQVLARGHAESCYMGGCLTLHELAELRANPELLKQQYVEAMRDAMQKIVKDL